MIKAIDEDLELGWGYMDANNKIAYLLNRISEMKAAMEGCRRQLAALGYRGLS